MNKKENKNCLQYIDTIRKQQPDDLFIASVSFEPRCTYATTILEKSNYKAKEILLIRYHGDDKNKDVYENILIKYIHNIDTSMSTRVSYFDKYEIEGFYTFIENNYNNSKKYKTITIDVTTLTKQYLLVLLHCLRKILPNASIRLLYTPGVYGYNEVLSWGIRDVSVLPYLGSIGSEMYPKRALALLLGYESERAYSIYRYIEPSVILAIIANPPSHPGADIPSRKNNRIILEDPRTIVAEVSALWPDETAKLLREWYVKKEFKDYMWFISPLGTKMETVGVYLFIERMKNDPRAQIVYSSPLKYNSKKYTTGYDHNCIVYQMPPLQRKS